MASTRPMYTDHIVSSTHEGLVKDFIQKLETYWLEEKSHELNVLPVAHSLTAYDEGIERIRSSLDTVHNVFTCLVQHLTVRRNAACAVNRLPLEILQNIFEFSGESGMDWKTNQAITGVCSFWRNAALNDPRMWCCIDSYLAGKSYATLAVERSCSAPLSLLSSQPNGRTRKRWPKQWIADLAEAQASRLRALDITIFVKPTTGPSLHSPIFTCAAPMLERLDLGIHAETYPVLSSIFENDTPKLRTMSLIACRRPWLPGMYSNLVSLTVDTVLKPSTLPGEDVTILFSECPALETLRLHLTGFPTLPLSAHVLPKDDHQRPAMRHLRTIDLDMHIELAIHILSSIQLFPVTEEFSLNTDCDDSANSLVARLFSPHCLPSFLFQRLSSLKTVIGIFYVISIVGEGYGECTAPGWHETAGVVASFFVRLQSGHVSAAAHLEAMSGSICRNYTLPLLRTFHIEDTLYDSPMTATSTTPRAKLLHLCSPTVTALSLSIYPRHDFSEENDEHNVTFTSLLDSLRELAGFQSSPHPDLLPQLVECSFELHNLRVEQDPFQLAPLVRGLSSNLRKISIHNSCLIGFSMGEAVQFIEDLRQLSVPEVHWNNSDFRYILDPDGIELTNPVFPRDIWPKGEEYTWKCGFERNHRIADLIYQRQGSRHHTSSCCGYRAVAQV